MKRLFQPTILGAAIVFTFLSFTTDLPEVKAQSAKATFRSPPPPKTSPVTGNREGNAGRGAIQNERCPVTALPLTALVPVEPSGVRDRNRVWGQTISQYPTLWFYVPYDPNQGDFSAEFVLQDIELKKSNSIKVTLPSTPSVVSVQIPTTLPPLETGKLYKWFFQVKCGKANDSVSGWIQRVDLDPTVIRQIEAATPQQKVALYAENGIWYDALTVLGKELLRANPQYAKDNWESLLQAIGLEDFASKPPAK